MATCISSENPSSLQLSSLETVIAVLKRKRPRALTEEQKQKLDILIAYHSLQAEDAKELLTGIHCHLGRQLVGGMATWISC